MFGKFSGYFFCPDNFMLPYLLFGRRFANFKKKFVCFLAILSTSWHFLTFLQLFMKKLHIILTCMLFRRLSRIKLFLNMMKSYSFLKKVFFDTFSVWNVSCFEVHFWRVIQLRRLSNHLLIRIIFLLACILHVLKLKVLNTYFLKWYFYSIILRYSNTY